MKGTAFLEGVLLIAQESMPKERKYTFGPVPSRRLGLSLGVDVIPKKLCSLDCVYCEVGVTDKRGLARKEYLPANEILAEVKEVIAEYPGLDHITISGSGEPTLNSKIGDIIRGIKHMTNIPVAVLTNGTLLDNPDVRHDLMDADIVSLWPECGPFHQEDVGADDLRRWAEDPGG